jgi:hypothetical protein
MLIDELQNRSFAAHLNQNMLQPADSVDMAHLQQIPLISLPVQKALLRRGTLAPQRDRELRGGLFLLAPEDR